MQNRHHLLVQQHEEMNTYSILSVLPQNCHLIPRTSLVKNVKVKQQLYFNWNRKLKQIFRNLHIY